MGRALDGALAVPALISAAAAQDQPVAPDVNPIFALDTLGAALFLIALTMALHGYGMLMTLRGHNWLVQALKRFRSSAAGIIPLIVASWMILLTHIAELLVWTLFIRWQRAIPDFSNAFYFAILEYTTVGSRFTLPFRWRGLEGGLAIAGLLTFAWSTGVLMAMAMEFQRRYLRGGDGSPVDR
jgi:hypothetical protein